MKQYGAEMIRIRNLEKIELLEVSEMKEAARQQGGFFL
jgi:hypothetical protein